MSASAVHASCAVARPRVASSPGAKRAGVGDARRVEARIVHSPTRRSTVARGGELSWDEAEEVLSLECVRRHRVSDATPSRPTRRPRSRIRLPRRRPPDSTSSAVLVRGFHESVSAARVIRKSENLFFSKKSLSPLLLSSLPSDVSAGWATSARPSRFPSETRGPLRCASWRPTAPR